jgi:signal peptidase I
MLAANLSLLLPGLGHIYSGEILRGFAVMAAAATLFSGIFYYLLLPGVGHLVFLIYMLFFILVHLFGLLDAHRAAHRRNSELRLEPLTGKDPWLAAFLSIALPSGAGHLYCGRILAAIIFFALWCFLNALAYYVSQWLFPALTAYTVLVAVYAHSVCPESKTRKVGMKLFVITALVVLVVLAVGMTLGRTRLDEALRTKLQNAGILLR